MHAITIARPGGPEVLTWSEVPDPQPQAGEVVIDVAASAVNRADLMQRQGKYAPPPGAPEYPGMECSGTIVAVGRGVSEWHVGDEVCALLAGGGYAERVAVPAAQVLPIPDGVSLLEAAALPEVACTVWSNVFSTARLNPGEVLLVHGGASGVGTFALQLGSAYGARVFCTASKPKLERARAYGAEVAIDYKTEDFVQIVKDETGGHGADVILDNMGAKYLGRNIDVLATNGRLVVIGLQGGRKADLDLGALLTKRASVTATSLRGRPVVEKAQIVAEVRDHVWPLVSAGRVRPVIDRALAMQDAAEAHRVVAASEHVGKVLLVR
jgi:putative PIG3 family NAD(P)H quinone oxidoreductase